MGYCALPLIGLEADGGGGYYDLGESWGGGRGVLIRVDIILGLPKQFRELRYVPRSRIPS